MADAINARRDGDVFQARWFWLRAARLLDSISPVVRVGFEHGPKGLDDIWVEYDPSRAPPHLGIQRLGRIHSQCKWHVNPGTYTHEDLIRPEFIGATSKSFLNRVHDAYQKHHGSDLALRYQLVTNWQVAEADPLFGMLRSRSYLLDLDKFFDGRTPRSAAFGVRSRWLEHLGIEEKMLRELAPTLSLAQTFGSLDDLRDHLDFACGAVGLQRIPPESSTVPYDDLVYQWAAQGVHVYDRDLFRDLCKKEGLLKGAPNRIVSLGIKSFEHAIDRLEDRCVEVLNLVPEFDERAIRDDESWKVKLLPSIRAFVIANSKDSTRLRATLDTHITLAFAVGSVLDSKSGRTLEIEQRSPQRVLWTPEDDDAIATRPGWQQSEEVLRPDGVEYAIAVSLTHDVGPKVRAFLATSDLPIRALLTFEPTDGPSPRSVASGAHAFRLAECLAQAVKAYKEAFPSSTSPSPRVHLFVAAPNGFSAFLGQHVHILKPLTLYEFDFDGTQGGLYKASLSLP